MSWHHLKKKGGVDEQIVASLDGIDPDEWVATPIDREPQEDEEVVGAKVIKSVNKRKKLDQEGKWGRMSRRELGDIIEALEDRITALEKLVKTK